MPKNKTGRPKLTYETLLDKKWWCKIYHQYQNGEWEITRIAYIAGVSRKTVYKYFRLIEEYEKNHPPKRKK